MYKSKVQYDLSCLKHISAVLCRKVRQYNIFYRLRVLQFKNTKLQKEKNNPKLQDLLIK